MQQPGYLVISLDFELMWGMFDKVSIDSYGENIRGVHIAIPELLALFAARNIHATWATVGMLMYADGEALTAALPPEPEQPQYQEKALSSYRYWADHVRNKPDVAAYHFAPMLVQQIVATPGQELASHTFSHYYCLEEQVGGENGEAIFAADCRAMQHAAKQFGAAPTSIVFPRNQTSPEALRTCAAAGLTSYRGTEDHFLYRARTDNAQSNPLIRALRLLDHYLNISGHHTHPLTKSDTQGLVNIPASRFLRPYSRLLRHLEPLRLRRIKRAMTRAAKRGEVFHLWWHPHNFGVNRKENLANLIELLDHFAFLQTEYGMQSRNMNELAIATRSNSRKST